MSEVLVPGQSQLMEAYEARRAARDHVTQDLIDLGHAFQEDVFDPSPQDWAEFLGKDWELRLPRARVLIPDLNPVVPKMTLSRDQLQELQVPFAGIPTAVGLDLPSGIPLEALGLMYPEMTGHWTLATENGMNVGRADGYFLFEDVSNAPHTRTIVKELIGPGGLEERTGLRLITPIQYHLANYNHFIRTGQYLDRNTWARIGDPRRGGGVLDASVFGGGRPVVFDSWSPGRRYDYVGARLAGVAQLA